MKLISIDKSKCVQCRACAEVCPMGVIGMSDEGFPEPESYAYRLCINCGYCVDVCACAALDHRVRKRSASSDSAAAMKRYEVLQKKRKDASKSK